MADLKQLPKSYTSYYTKIINILFPAKVTPYLQETCLLWPSSGLLQHCTRIQHIR